MVTGGGGLRRGKRMKGNLIDEKEERGRGVAAGDRSTLETGEM